MEGSLHPDETVYMNDSLWKAGDALEHARQEGTLIHESDNTRTYDAGLTTRTLDETGTLRRTDCLLYEKAFDGEQISLETKTGRQIVVSDNHPFLVNRDGIIQWIEAGNLDTSDHLVSPAELSVTERSLPTHEQAIEALDSEGSRTGTVIDRERVSSLEVARRERPLDRGELDDLRIACGFSKTELASHVEGTYEQVLNYFSGAKNGLGSEIQAVLRDRPIRPGGYAEAHRIHHFDESLTPAEAGFFVGFVLADGHYTNNAVSIIQKTLPERFDRWVSLARKLGFDPEIEHRDNDVRVAKISSRPLVEYLTYRYSLDEPASLLSAPESFRESFLEIFLLTDSHYDSERGRISFVQKDRETTNLIAHLLLQFGIRPWIYDMESRFEIRIQGNDIETYLERFDWRGEIPEAEDVSGRHRTLPISGVMMERIVDNLGLAFEQDLSDREWYNAYTYARSGEGPATEHLVEAFLEHVQAELGVRNDIDIETRATQNIAQSARSCGLSMTDIVDGTELTKHRVRQAYQGECETPEAATEFVTDQYTDRLREAQHLTDYLSTLVNGDVFYDPVVDIEREPYEGPVIGLSVPRTHNYLGGLGACGISHNTFSLPEAQRDRFQQKLLVDLPSRENEAMLFDRFASDPELDVDVVKQVATPGGIMEARETVTDVYVDKKVREYVLDIVAATRDMPDVRHGASPRATLAFLNAGKARAAIKGRKYVTPDDIKTLAPAVLRHRLILSTDAQLSDLAPDEVVEDVLSSVTAPGAEAVDVDTTTTD
jgi:intein/homing endonuclease